MYQPDPVEAVRRLAARVVPGGLVVFMEADTIAPPNVAPLPLHTRVREWIWSTVQRIGAHPHMGFGLYSTFAAAGLAGVQVRAEVVLHTPRTHYPLAHIVRFLLPRMIEHGIVTAEEADVDTLDDRLQAEREAAGTAYAGDLVFEAWARA